MKTVTAQHMRELDQETIESGTSGEILMERAGIGAAVEILEFVENLNPKHVEHFVILAGKGNNGGDGYVIARLLCDCTDYKISVLSMSEPSDLKGDAKVNAEMLPPEVEHQVCTRIDEHLLSDSVIFIDCLLGTGISGEVKEPYLSIIDQVNSSGRPVISIDVPSGIDADSGSVANAAIVADLTVTIGLPKTGLFQGQGLHNSGQLRLVDIGIPANFIERKPAAFDSIFHRDIRPLFQRLPKTVHKGGMGRILVIGGSDSFPGAPLLSATGALRAGGGLVTVAYPKSIAPMIHPTANALILHPTDDQGAGYHTPLPATSFHALIDNKDVIAIGPGLGTHEKSQELVDSILSTSKTIILDADAFLTLKKNTDCFPRTGTTVLTPHPGEMIRLLSYLNLSIPPDADRITQATSLASRLNAYIVLKGAATVIAGPSGEVAVNSSGCAALASGGTGDVLTGVIAAFLCQFENYFDALKCAVFVHGLAAELAPYGMRNLIADDLLTLIGLAMSDLSPFA